MPGSIGHQMTRFESLTARPLSISEVGQVNDLLGPALSDVSFGQPSWEDPGLLSRRWSSPGINMGQLRSGSTSQLGPPSRKPTFRKRQGRAAGPRNLGYG